MSTVENFGLPQFEEIEAALASDAPRRWGLETSRSFSLIVEPEQGALWLLCPAEDEPPPVPSSTTVIQISSRKLRHRLHYQVGSQFPYLLREVYYFLCGVVCRAEQSSEPLPDVIESELAAWEALLRNPISIDRNWEIGLLGELWVLWRVLRNLGAGAIDCWTGPASEPHDFRLSNNDLEVKTTISHCRDHVISGLAQLVTSGVRPLAVVSIQLKPAGGGPGTSLREAVNAISRELSSDPTSLNKFNEKLVSIGYRHGEGTDYSDRYCLRSSPTVVPVDGEFPLITTDSLTTVLTSTSLRRIRKVIYTVNLDGMGAELDSENPCDELRHHDSGDLYA